MSEKDCLLQHEEAVFTPAEFPVRVSNFTRRGSPVCGKRRDLSYMDFGVTHLGGKFELSDDFLKKNKTDYDAGTNEALSGILDYWRCGDWVIKGECLEGNGFTKYFHPDYFDRKGE